jgi:hypothetical protein
MCLFLQITEKLAMRTGFLGESGGASTAKPGAPITSQISAAVSRSPTAAGARRLFPADDRSTAAR